MIILYPENCINRDISCIYKITDNTTGLVYIGQTINYRKRSSDYKNAQWKNKKHPIYKIIAEKGDEYFTMEVLEICSPEDLTERERFYIEKFDSANPMKGYNITSGFVNDSNNPLSRLRKSISHMGLKESDETKRKKSNMIIAIKDNDIMFCDSGKLFGDFIGKSKDMVKNCLREPSSISGYRIYYADPVKRNEIRDKMLKKRSIRSVEYMNTLEILDEFEEEGVETIYRYFDKAYFLCYDSTTESGWRLDEIE